MAADQTASNECRPRPSHLACGTRWRLVCATCLSCRWPGFPPAQPLSRERGFDSSGTPVASGTTHGRASLARKGQKKCHTDKRAWSDGTRKTLLANLELAASPTVPPFPEEQILSGDVSVWLGVGGDEDQGLACACACRALLLYCMQYRRHATRVPCHADSAPDNTLQRERRPIACARRAPIACVCSFAPVS